MSATYAILAHPADVGFSVESQGTGPDSFIALLGGAVRALADVETGGHVPAPTDERPLREAYPDAAPDERVVDVLEQCLVWLDTEDWLATGVSEDGKKLLGTELSEEAREAGTHVKAITWHQLSVVQDASGWKATVFVDL